MAEPAAVAPRAQRWRRMRTAGRGSGDGCPSVQCRPRRPDRARYHGAVSTVATGSEAETSDVGRDLGATLSAGDVVLLYGDLGAGKTAFVKGLAEGLGVSRDEVSSPTFTLVQEYRGGRLTLFHVDLYRLDDPREIADLGLDE